MSIRNLLCASAAAMSLPGSANACMVPAAQRLEDVKRADAVLIGRITDYRVVRDEAFRKRMLSSPDLPAARRAWYQDPTKTILSDFARFDFQVDATLFGRAPQQISVTWNNSTFEEPNFIESGKYLIAVNWPRVVNARSGNRSAPIAVRALTAAAILLQSPCSSPFMFKADSEPAQAVRNFLRATTKG